MIRTHVSHQLPDGITSRDIYFTPRYAQAATVTTSVSGSFSKPSLARGR